jgi:exodeoxyribonuclease V beta subunit
MSARPRHLRLVPPPVPAFDPCGDLPTGVTVLEASAGTGKTFTIAALAAREVARGTPLEQMLVVTFTRMATGELRDRVRERLVSAEAGLARALAGAPLPPDDAVLALLARGGPEEVEERRRLLARALADFDAATITTIHGFCQQVLGGLGVSGDVEREVVFAEDISGLVEEVVDDLYVRRFHRDGGADLTHAQARAIGRAAIDHPIARLEPRDAPETHVAAMRRRLADAVRAEVERRKRALALMTYDDLLTRLQQALADPERGARSCARLRERFRVVLVDEFQDTDPIQWDVMRRAFGDGGTTLILIGDPKQAIYAFRGADVHAYLQAARTAGAQATLGTNWRSDQGLLDAYEALFGGARLGHPEIVHRPVRAAEGHRLPGLADAPVDAPLRLRVVHREDGHVQLTRYEFAQVGSARRHVAEDLAADLVRLLESPARLVPRDGSDGPGEPVRPGHVAVLVRTNRQAAMVRDALEAAGVPAVINGAGSVFATPAATEWLRLLEALERPTSRRHAAAAALTGFLGWSAERVAAAGEPDWEELHARLHRWAGLLRRRGVASLQEAVTRTQAVPARILGRADGERALTDLRHVGQLLHAAATEGGLGVTALAAWLRRRTRDARVDADEEEASRRLESDAEAVQVLTVHRSKGLEFPIVYCPFLWDPFRIGDEDPPVFHDPDTEERVIDVGGGAGPDYPAHRTRYVEEQRGEELRLAYVALTRARHQAVVWWCGSYDSRHSPIARLLFSRTADGEVAAEGSSTPADAAVVARFEAIAAAAPGCVAVERAGGGAGAVWTPPADRPADLRAGRFARELDARWRRTSYSGITEGAYEAHEARVASEPEEGAVPDEGPPAGRAAGADEPGHAALRAPAAAPLAGMPAGVEFGSLVHGVLERADFTAPDLTAELAPLVASELLRHPVEIEDRAAAVTGLAAAIETPLGPLAGGLRLRDLARADRLDELSFELPLAGGDAPAGELELGALARLLRERVPAGDPLEGYADRLEEPGLQRELRGFLVGSIDLVARLRGPDGEPRFLVLDYKTNRLAAEGAPATPWHYRPEALAREMHVAHYPLQALLYSVALYRYLRWRLPGRDPAGQPAGVLYLFLRGMTGPETPRVGGGPCGVFAWRPPAGLVPALSDLLDRGGPR